MNGMERMEAKCFNFYLAVKWKFDNEEKEFQCEFSEPQECKRYLPFRIRRPRNWKTLRPLSRKSSSRSFILCNKKQRGCPQKEKSNQHHNNWAKKNSRRGWKSQQERSKQRKNKRAIRCSKVKKSETGRDYRVVSKHYIELGFPKQRKNVRKNITKIFMLQLN